MNIQEILKNFVNASLVVEKTLDQFQSILDKCTEIVSENNKNCGYYYDWEESDQTHLWDYAFVFFTKKKGKSKSINGIVIPVQNHAICKIPEIWVINSNLTDELELKNFWDKWKSKLNIDTTMEKYNEWFTKRDDGIEIKIKRLSFDGVQNEDDIRSKIIPALEFVSEL